MIVNYALLLMVFPFAIPFSFTSEDFPFGRTFSFKSFEWIAVCLLDFILCIGKSLGAKSKQIS